MSILRTIHCDICGVEEREPAPNAGWAGWGEVRGISIDGADNPNACPVCLAKVGQFLDEVKHGMD